MTLSAFTDDYGFSGWGKPKSLTGRRYIYTGWNTSSPVKEFTYPSTPNTQYVSRSGKLSGGFWDLGGGKRLRMPTAYDLVIYERTDFGREFGSGYGWGWQTKYDDQPFSPNFADVGYASGLFNGFAPKHLGDASEEAQTQALNKLTESDSPSGSQASFGSALLQMRSTLSDIGRITSALVKGTSHAMAGNYGRAFNALGISKDLLSHKGASDKFLFGIYGILPTVNDLKDLHDQMRGHAATTKILRIRGQANRTDGWSGTISGGHQSTVTVSTGARCGIVAAVIDPVIHSLSQQGLINPASIAWDLVPYSFVFDWLLPIGDILRGYESELGLQFISGYISQRTTANVTTTVTPYDTGSFRGSGTSTTDETFRFTRTGLTSFPMPSMYIKKNWASTWHGAEALALLSQTSPRLRS